MGEGRTDHVKRRRHTLEQIVRKLREADRLIAEGWRCRRSRRRWRSPSRRITAGVMQADDVKRLQELERENAQLKRLVAEKELENLALREISKGNW
jgi:hypothetical protein